MNKAIAIDDLAEIFHDILDQVEAVLHAKDAWLANGDDYREALQAIAERAGDGLLELGEQPEEPTFQELLDAAAEEIIGALLPGARAGDRLKSAQLLMDRARERKAVAS